MPIILSGGFVDLRLLTFSLETPLTITLHYFVRRQPNTTEPMLLFLLRELDTKILRVDSNELNAETRGEQVVRTVINEQCKSSIHFATLPELRLLKSLGLISTRAPRVALIEPHTVIRILRHFDHDIKALILESVLLSLMTEQVLLKQLLLSIKSTVFHHNVENGLKHDYATSHDLIKTKNGELGIAYPPPWHRYFSTESEPKIPIFDVMATNLLDAVITASIIPERIPSTWSLLSNNKGQDDASIKPKPNVDLPTADPIKRLNLTNHSNASSDLSLRGATSTTSSALGSTKTTPASATMSTITTTTTSTAGNSTDVHPRLIYTHHFVPSSHSIAQSGSKMMDYSSYQSPSIPTLQSNHQIPRIQSQSPFPDSIPSTPNIPSDGGSPFDLSGATSPNSPTEIDTNPNIPMQNYNMTDFPPQHNHDHQSQSIAIPQTSVITPSSSQQTTSHIRSSEMVRNIGDHFKQLDGEIDEIEELLNQLSIKTLVSLDSDKTKTDLLLSYQVTNDGPNREEVTQDMADQWQSFGIGDDFISSFLSAITPSPSTRSTIHLALHSTAIKELNDEYENSYHCSDNGEMVEVLTESTPLLNDQTSSTAVITSSAQTNTITQFPPLSTGKNISSATDTASSPHISQLISTYLGPDHITSPHHFKIIPPPSIEDNPSLTSKLNIRNQKSPIPNQHQFFSDQMQFHFKPSSLNWILLRFQPALRRRWDMCPDHLLSGYPRVLLEKQRRNLTRLHDEFFVTSLSPSIPSQPLATSRTAKKTIKKAQNSDQHSSDPMSPLNHPPQPPLNGSITSCISEGPMAQFNSIYALNQKVHFHLLNTMFMTTVATDLPPPCWPVEGFIPAPQDPNCKSCLEQYKLYVERNKISAKRPLDEDLMTFVQNNHGYYAPCLCGFLESADRSKLSIPNGLINDNDNSLNKNTIKNRTNEKIDEKAKNNNKNKHPLPPPKPNVHQSPLSPPSSVLQSSFSTTNPNIKKDIPPSYRYLSQFLELGNPVLSAQYMNSINFGQDNGGQFDQHGNLIKNDDNDDDGNGDNGPSVKHRDNTMTDRAIEHTTTTHTNLNNDGADHSAMHNQPSSEGNTRPYSQFLHTHDPDSFPDQNNPKIQQSIGPFPSQEGSTSSTAMISFREQSPQTPFYPSNPPNLKFGPSYFNSAFLGDTAMLTYPSTIAFSTLITLSTIYYRSRNPFVPRGKMGKRMEDGEDQISAENASQNFKNDNDVQNNHQDSNIFDDDDDDDVIAFQKYQSQVLIESFVWLVKNLKYPVVYSTGLLEFNDPVALQSLYPDQCAPALYVCEDASVSGFAPVGIYDLGCDQNQQNHQHNAGFADTLYNSGDMGNDEDDDYHHYNLQTAATTTTPTTTTTTQQESKATSTTSTTPLATPSHPSQLYSTLATTLMNDISSDYNATILPDAYIDLTVSANYKGPHTIAPPTSSIPTLNQALSMFPYEIIEPSLYLWRGFVYHLEILSPAHKMRLFRHAGMVFPVSDTDIIVNSKGEKLDLAKLSAKLPKTAPRSIAADIVVLPPLGPGIVSGHDGNDSVDDDDGDQQIGDGIAKRAKGNKNTLAIPSGGHPQSLPTDTGPNYQPAQPPKPEKPRRGRKSLQHHLEHGTQPEWAKAKLKKLRAEAAAEAMAEEAKMEISAEDDEIVSDSFNQGKKQNDKNKMKALANHQTKMYQQSGKTGSSDVYDTTMGIGGLGGKSGGKHGDYIGNQDQGGDAHAINEITFGANQNDDTNDYYLHHQTHTTASNHESSSLVSTYPRQHLFNSTQQVQTQVPMFQPHDLVQLDSIALNKTPSLSFGLDTNHGNYINNNHNNNNLDNAHSIDLQLTPPTTPLAASSLLPQQQLHLGRSLTSFLVTPPVYPIITNAEFDELYGESIHDERFRMGGSSFRNNSQQPQPQQLTPLTTGVFGLEPPTFVPYHLDSPHFQSRSLSNRNASDSADNGHNTTTQGNDIDKTQPNPGYSPRFFP